MIRRLLLTLLVSLAALGHLIAADSGSSRPLVVCSTTQIADFARQIGGDDIDVRCLLAPGADPHTYQPTTRDAELVLAADLCLANGLHLEGSDWMGKLAADAGRPVVICTQGVELLQMEEDGEQVPDPHAWFDPTAAATYVRNVNRALRELLPAKAAPFDARTALYLEQLRTLDSWISRQVASLPAERRVLVTSHDAFNYFCRRYGFTSRAPVGWSTAELEGGVTPKRRQAVIDAIGREGIAAVFIETSVSGELLREIAKEAGVRIGGTLYSDSMGAEGTAGANYIGMMRENTLTILAGLR